ncbi:YdcF family protein [Myxacorys almedinensis]|uniref:YdcF family protein n=1 Tax=Myxacorys almedinensis A TaxID=2690445 RepID=A0A8J7YYS3_9CYAN|nr:YdcF family protein [Myxacorys almedinensis]NDJ16539.1 YdcF family protein [Myxacorys almedinensis A]
MRSRSEFSPQSRSVSARRVTKRSRRRSFPWAWAAVPLVLWFGVRTIRIHFEQPDAILVLGGAAEREQFTAEFAKQYPDLPIWVSSGTPRDYSEWVFSEAGVDLNRLNLDYRAVDTVTNFTTLVDRFQQQGIRSVYVVTSDYHMRRAQMIGEIVLGSRGIHLKPVSVPSTQAPEPLLKALRDGGRAFVWIATGHTGSSLTHLKDGKN